jgi:hypothetical protein
MICIDVVLVAVVIHAALLRPACVDHSIQLKAKGFPVNLSIQPNQRATQPGKIADPLGYVKKSRLG